MKTSTTLTSYLFLLLCLSLSTNQSLAQGKIISKDQLKSPINTQSVKAQSSAKKLQESSKPFFHPLYTVPEAHLSTTACQLMGGNVQGSTDIVLCLSDGAFTMSTIDEVTDLTYPDIGWGVWLLAAPNGGGTTGPIPNDQNMFDDPNFLGLTLGSPETTVTVPPYGNGNTYYFAPFVYDATNTGVDPNCNGLAPGYTIYMNPPIGYSANYNSCTFTVDFNGGYPDVDPTADYNWSYVDPSGNTVTGSGSSINVLATEDGAYVFSLDNDGLNGNQCSLPDFWTVEVYGCACSADAGTFFTLPSTTPQGRATICFGDDFSYGTNGDWGGSHEDAGANDQAANGGDGDFFNGVVFGVYEAPPSNEDPIQDPALIGLFGSSPQTAGGPDIISSLTNDAITQANLATNTPYYLTTIYAFDIDGPGGIIVAVDATSNGTFDCVDVNLTDYVELVLLDEITAPYTINNNNDITFTLNGGMPAFDGSSFTVSGDGPGGLVANNGNYTIAAHPANTPFSIIVTDDSGCAQTFSGISSSFINLSAKLFLEGPYIGGMMRTDLIPLNSFPSIEPYTDLGYFRENAEGGETLNTVPQALQENIVDWVLLEFRAALNSENIVATKAVFVLEDGQIIDEKGSTLLSVRLSDASVEDFVLAIRHRSHLSTITDQTCSINGPTCIMDLTTADLAGQKLLGNGHFGLIAGSADGDDAVDAADRSAAWNGRNTAGYLIEDVNMDNYIDAEDRSIIWNNRNSGVVLP